LRLAALEASPALFEKFGVDPFAPWPIFQPISNQTCPWLIRSRTTNA